VGNSGMENQIFLNFFNFWQRDCNSPKKGDFRYSRLGFLVLLSPQKLKMVLIFS
jgi:hypothetical protein